MQPVGRPTMGWQQGEGRQRWAAMASLKRVEGMKVSEEGVAR